MVFRFEAFTALLFFVLVTASSAANSATENCWVQAGEKYDVDPWLLYAIGQVESNLNPSAINHNATTKDIGILQINSWWFDKLAEHGITESALYDACTNIFVGAWVLAQSFQAFGVNWEGIGAYNAGTAKSDKAKARRLYYANKVINQYNHNIKTHKNN
jgi:soluble lytic murein transglycosylase-like protein